MTESAAITANDTETFENDTPKEKKKVEYGTLFWLFLIGSFLGVILEGVWYLIDHGHWETHVITIHGPWCIIYGFGMAGCYLGSVLMADKKPFQRFLTFALIGAGVEFLCGWTILRVLGMRAWDYSEKFLNFMGLVDFNMAIVWGLIGVVFNRAVPFIDRCAAKMKGKFWNAALFVMTIYMAMNLLWTTTVLVRWSTRHDGYEAQNAISRKIDDWYPDSYLEDRYVEWWFDEDELENTFLSKIHEKKGWERRLVASADVKL